MESQKTIRSICIVASGQIISSAVFLLGNRLLTQFVPPETYGSVTLLLGFVSLGSCLFIVPICQTFIAFVAEAKANQTLPVLKGFVVKSLLVAQLPIQAILLTAAFYWVKAAGSFWALALPLCVLGLLDSVRSYITTSLISSQLHKQNSLYAGLDQSLRPFLSLVAIYLWGISEFSIITGAVFGGILVLIFSVPHLRKRNLRANPFSETPKSLSSNYYAFLTPVFFIGLSGWLSSMGDRYVIGEMLSLADAGIFAIAYGLASKPIAILASTLETVFQNPLHEYAAAGDKPREKRAFRKYLLLLSVSCGLYIIGLTLGGDRLFTYLFLGPAYARASSLLTWIAAGHFILALANAYHRRLYMYKRTNISLYIRALSAVASVVIPAIFLERWGLEGAAWACPIYFLVDLLLVQYAVWSREKVFAPLS